MFHQLNRLPHVITPPYHNRRPRKCCLERHDRLETVRTLPAGGQGQLEVVRRRSNGELLVKKSIPHSLVEYFLGKNENEPVEVKILRDFVPDHNRIIAFLDYSVDIRNITLYYDYCRGGDLHELIYKFSDAKEDVPELLIWQAFRQMCEALAFLHFGHDANSSRRSPRWRKVVHRDIKPPNVLLREVVVPGGRSQPSFVLADFGLATTMQDLEEFGTPEFQAPERAPHTEKVDVWGLGATMHAMAHKGKAPIIPMPASVKYNAFLMDAWCRNPAHKLPRSFGSNYSLALELLVFKTFEHNPDQRINSLDLLKDIEKDFSPRGRAHLLQTRAATD